MKRIACFAFLFCACNEPKVVLEMPTELQQALGTFTSLSGRVDAFLGTTCGSSAPYKTADLDVTQNPITVKLDVAQAGQYALLMSFYDTRPSGTKLVVWQTCSQVNVISGERTAAEIVTSQGDFFDADGDGISNLDEIRLGYDPEKSPLAIEKAQSIAPSNGASLAMLSNATIAILDRGYPDSGSFVTAGVKVVDRDGATKWAAASVYGAVYDRPRERIIGLSGGASDCNIVALDAVTGTQLWSKDAGLSGDCDNGLAGAPTVLGDGSVWVAKKHTEGGAQMLEPLGLPTSCTTAANCPAGNAGYAYACKNSMCAEMCQTSGQCPANYSCTQNVCTQSGLVRTDLAVQRVSADGATVTPLFGTGNETAMVSMQADPTMMNQWMAPGIDNHWGGGSTVLFLRQSALCSPGASSCNAKIVAFSAQAASMTETFAVGVAAPIPGRALPAVVLQDGSVAVATDTTLTIYEANGAQRFAKTFTPTSGANQGSTVMTPVPLSNNRLAISAGSAVAIYDTTSGNETLRIPLTLTGNGTTSIFEQGARLIVGGVSGKLFSDGIAVLDAASGATLFYYSVQQRGSPAIADATRLFVLAKQGSKAGNEIVVGSGGSNGGQSTSAGGDFGGGNTPTTSLLGVDVPQ